MTVTSGFFNSVNHDRKYNAEEISSIFDGIILDGVYQGFGEAFKVSGTSVANQVKIGTGRAWFNHTWTLNDEALYLTLPAPNSTYPRIDAIVLEVNNSSSVRANTIKYISGTAASSPTKPTLTNTTDVHQYPLAYITRPNTTSTITAGDIENTIGTSACPIVIGVLESLNDDRYISQVVTNLTTDFNTWFDGIKGQLSGDVAVNLANRISEVDKRLSKKIDVIDNRISDISIIPKRYLGSSISQEQINDIRSGGSYDIGDYWIINNHYYIVVGTNTYTQNLNGYDCHNKNHLVLLYLASYSPSITNSWVLKDAMFNSGSKKISDRYTWYVVGERNRSSSAYFIDAVYYIPFEKKLYPLDTIKNDIIQDVGKNNLLTFPILSNEGISGKTYAPTDMLVISVGDLNIEKMPSVNLNSNKYYYFIDLGNSGLPIDNLYTEFLGYNTTYTMDSAIIKSYNDDVIRKRIINMCSDSVKNNKYLSVNKDKIYFGDVAYYLGSAYDADSSNDQYGSYSFSKKIVGYYSEKAYPLDKLQSWNSGVKNNSGVYYTDNGYFQTEVVGGIKNYSNTESKVLTSYDAGGAVLSEFNYNNPSDKSIVRNADYSIFKTTYSADKYDSCIPIIICV